MNTYSIITADSERFALGRRATSSTRRARGAGLVGVAAIAAVLFVATITAEAGDATPTACSDVEQAFPSDAELDARDSAGWPGETPSVDIFALSARESFSCL